MSTTLSQLPPEVYAREILPLTASLWANGRPFDTYVAQTLELFDSAYGKKHFRTFGFAVDDRLVASFKWYERMAVLGEQRLAGMGIGAVFTPAQERGRGYASAMIALALDRARSQKFDFAYLFSDIHPQFYKALGFVELPSRAIRLRADALASSRLNVHALDDRDWPSVRRCFESAESRRDFGFERGPLIWQWLKTQAAHQAVRKGGQPVSLGMRRGRSIAAYVMGRREPSEDAFVLDEFAYGEKSDSELVAPLLRAAAGDLRTIGGWLPSESVPGALPRGAIRRRKTAILMVAPLTKRGAAFVERARRPSDSDAVWSADHI